MFADYIKSNTSTQPFLPILHTTDVYTLRSILASKAIEPRSCTVFIGQKNLYAFYGRPSYRLHQNLSTQDIAGYPVCFILDYSFLPRITDIYPFDTGAFIQNNELKNKFFHPKMKLEDFNLGSDISVVKSLVTLFYGTNKNYIEYHPNKEFIAQSSELEVQAYYNMISSSDSSSFDDRIATIEFKFQEPIILSTDSLKGLILPKTFYQDPQVQKSLEEYKISFLRTYYTARGNPKEFHGLIFNYVVEYIETI